MADKQAETPPKRDRSVTHNPVCQECFAEQSNYFLPEENLWLCTACHQIRQVIKGAIQTR